MLFFCEQVQITYKIRLKMTINTYLKVKNSINTYLLSFQNESDAKQYFFFNIIA